GRCTMADAAGGSGSRTPRRGAGGHRVQPLGRDVHPGVGDDVLRHLAPALARRSRADVPSDGRRVAGRLARLHVDGAELRRRDPVRFHGLSVAHPRELPGARSYHRTVARPPGRWSVIAALAVTVALAASACTSSPPPKATPSATSRPSVVGTPALPSPNPDGGVSVADQP